MSTHPKVKTLNGFKQYDIVVLAPNVNHAPYIGKRLEIVELVPGDRDTGGDRWDGVLLREHGEYSHGEWFNVLSIAHEKTDTDMVNQPPHYKTESGLEAIDVIEAFKLNFRLGNTVKYILRHGSKGAALQDLQKAQWYLSREIDQVRKANK